MLCPVLQQMPVVKGPFPLTSKNVSHDKTQMPGQRNRSDSLSLIPSLTRTFGKKRVNENLNLY